MASKRKVTVTSELVGGVFLATSDICRWTGKALLVAAAIAVVLLAVPCVLAYILARVVLANVHPDDVQAVREMASSVKMVVQRTWGRVVEHCYWLANEWADCRDGLVPLIRHQALSGRDYFALTNRVRFQRYERRQRQAA